MTIAMKRAGLAAAVAALIGAGACSNKAQPVDASLRADLEAAGGSTSDLQLAPTSAKSQVVVSAIEGGPESAPKKAATKPIPHPSPKPTIHVAQQRSRAPAPVAKADNAAPAPAQQAPVIEAPAPAEAPAAAPAPAQAPREDHRVYKTEGEIFKQMPWIRP
jgi:hypothetical protein